MLLIIIAWDRSRAGRPGERPDADHYDHNINNGNNVNSNYFYD